MRSCKLLVGVALAACLAAPSIAQEAVHEGHVPEQAVPSADTGSAASSGATSPAREAMEAANEKMHQACIDLSAEWQAFVGRRVNEDFHLLQELSAAKAPSEIWNAWARFWQKAVEDYGAECACMAKLAAGLLPSDVAISQNDSDSNTQTARRQAKAA